MTTAPTLLVAAQTLAAAAPNEAVILDAFCLVSHAERMAIANALETLVSVLASDSKFQPALLDESIKIPVSTYAEGAALQDALFRLGCGYHHGRFPLAQSRLDGIAIGCLFVSKKGVMSVMGTTSADKDYAAQSPLREVSAERVLAATSLADLNRAPGGGLTPEEVAHAKALYRLLDDAHTEAEEEGPNGFLLSFREWLDKAAADPYHQYHAQAKEQLRLEALGADWPDAE